MVLLSEFPRDGSSRCFSGSQANIASLTDSLLELPVACLQQGGSIAGMWHICFARIIWQKESIHERLWLRILELCRDHCAVLSSHQARLAPAAPQFWLCWHLIVCITSLTRHSSVYYADTGSHKLCSAVSSL